MKLITKYFSNFYSKDLLKFYQYNLNKEKNILEINHENYSLLKETKYKLLVNYENNNIKTKGKFDYIIIPDTLSTVLDIQKLFSNIHNNCKKNTRLIINYHNFLWLPILNLAEKLHLKKSQNRSNWLNTDDLTNLL